MGIFIISSNVTSYCNTLKGIGSYGNGSISKTQKISSSPYNDSHILNAQLKIILLLLMKVKKITV